MALAKQGQSKILIVYHGDINLQNREIETGLNSIADLKIGKSEKLAHVFDSLGGLAA